MLILKMEKVKYIINEEVEGMRLDKATTILDKDISRMMVQKLLDNGNIFINRKNSKSFI